MSISINGVIPKVTEDKTGVSYFACTCAEQDKNYWNTQREEYIAVEGTNPVCFATSMLYEIRLFRCGLRNILLDILVSLRYRMNRQLKRLNTLK